MTTFYARLGSVRVAGRKAMRLLRHNILVQQVLKSKHAPQVGCILQPKLHHVVMPISREIPHELAMILIGRIGRSFSTRLAPQIGVLKANDW